MVIIHGNFRDSKYCRTRNYRKKLDGGRILTGKHVSGSAKSTKTQRRVVVVAGHDAASAAPAERHAQAEESFKEGSGR